MSNPSGYVFINDGGSNVNFVNTSTTTSVAAPSIAATNTSATTTTSTDNTTANTSNNVDNMVTSSSTPSSSSIAPAPQALFTLPDGRLIDGKNTLQSFDGGNGVTQHPVTTTTTLGDRDGSKNSESQPPPELWLPDGRMIDGKNTLQSFAVPVQRPMKAPPPPPPAAITNPVHTTTTETTTSVVAIAVAEEEQQQQSNSIAPVQLPIGNVERTVHAEPVAVVDAQISESQIDLLLYQPPPPKLRKLYWLALIVILSFLLIGIATFCGTGNCSNSAVSPSALLQPSMSPTTSYDHSLAVACNFLNTADISECQNITEFSRNLLGDTIPSEIGLLTQMTILELDKIQLTGSIPSTIGELSQLENLLLNENQLTGIIPSNLGNLTHLVELRLNENLLSGTIPSVLGEFKQLTLLRLHTNLLNGTIPSTLGNLTQLTSLSLRDNQLHGTVPSSLGGLTLLTGLWLFNNTQLTGTIPSILCSVSKLDIRIDCANIVCACCFNSFGNTSCSANAPTTSSIKAPTTKTLLPTKAPITISLSPTKVPTRLEEEELLVACNFLNISSLSECQTTVAFDGRSVGNTLPTELGLLTQLTSLSLIQNQLIGTIPSTLGNLKQLTVLYLTTNQLTGTVPSTLGNLVNLTNLSLYDNQLTGAIPSALGSLTQLTNLDLDSNQLNGTIPSALCSVTGIEIYIDCAEILCTCCKDSNSDSCL